MDLITLLIVLIVVSKVLLIVCLFFLWRTNTRLKEANRIIFLLKRRSIINGKHLESLRNADK